MGKSTFRRQNDNKIKNYQKLDYQNQKLRRPVHKFPNLAVTWRETLNETWALVKLNNKILGPSPAFLVMSGPCLGQDKISARGMLKYSQTGLLWDIMPYFGMRYFFKSRKILIWRQICLIIINFVSFYSVIRL